MSNSYFSDDDEDDDDDDKIESKSEKKISDPKIDAKVLKLKAQLDSIKNISDEENSESARSVHLKTRFLLAVGNREEVDNISAHREGVLKVV